MEDQKVRCELCGQVFNRTTAKASRDRMRRHRKSHHPDHVGSIRYVLVKVGAGGTAE